LCDHLNVFITPIHDDSGFSMLELLRLHILGVTSAIYLMLGIVNWQNTQPMTRSDCDDMWLFVLYRLQYNDVVMSIVSVRIGFFISSNYFMIILSF